MQVNDAVTTLPPISQNAMIQLSMDNDWIVTAFDDNPGLGPVLQVAPEGSGGVSVFTVTLWEPGGDGTAKISLSDGGSRYWMVVPGHGGITYPVSLGPDSDTFLMTALPDGSVSLQTTFSPPPPYIQSLEVGNPSPLAYGFDAPLLNGMFYVEVVG
jgi:hypothetical protein